MNTNPSPLRRLGQRLVSSALACLTVLALAALAVPTRASAQPTQTLTILGGSGNVGDVAANVEYYNPATGNWQSAYLADYAPYGWPVTHPWGNVAGTNHWINYRTDGVSDPGAGLNGTNSTYWYLYRVRFTVPADAVNPHMTFSIKADNFAQVAINGVTTGGSTQYINYTNMPNVIVGAADQLNADAVFSQAVHPGENTITLNIGDWGGLNGFNFRIDLSMQSSQPLEIVPTTTGDTAPPVIASVTPSTATLWPPNHQMVPVSVTVNATDNVGVVSRKITAVSSSEPDNGLGDGDTAGDVVITGDLTVSLRAERSGKGNGRTYTIYVEAKDAAGNKATGTCTVSVPKSQGK